MSQAIATHASGSTVHFTPLEPAVHHKPLRIADDVYLIRQLQGEGTAPMCVYINSLVIAGREPVIVDTGTLGNSRRWLDDVFSIVAPKAVRWVFLTHDDVDHTGNLEEVLRACPDAVLVATWLMVERMACELNLPLTRMRWVDDGGHLQLGDRTLVALRPPTYDSPATRGLFDTRSRVYYASDSFGAVVPHCADTAADLDEAAWCQGLAGFNSLLSPWVSIADPKRFADRVTAVRSLEARAIASTHGPLVDGSRLEVAYETMNRLPEIAAHPMPTPDQADLEAIVAAITGATPVARA